jgi:hypothetical protein
VTDVKDLYHYTDSGLRNVYLKNGYSIKKTPYGRGVSIHDIAGLHQLLGMELVCNKAGKLSSTEIRFLRVEMDLASWYWLKARRAGKRRRDIDCKVPLH